MQVYLIWGNPLTFNEKKVLPQIWFCTRSTRPFFNSVGPLAVKCLQAWYLTSWPLLCITLPFFNWGKCIKRVSTKPRSNPLITEKNLERYCRYLRLYLCRFARIGLSKCVFFANRKCTNCMEGLSNYSHRCCSVMSSPQLSGRYFKTPDLYPAEVRRANNLATPHLIIEMVRVNFRCRCIRRTDIKQKARRYANDVL